MQRKVPPSLYWPVQPRQVEALLRKGEVPPAFTRRMRTINLLSATTLMKMEDSLLLPFDVMAMHHILDNLISQDAILDQMDSDELSYACTTGNIRPLWDIAPEFPLLQRGFTSGWINRFILEPFDPLCVMLAMRAKAMLDLVDEEGHSYNLIRKLGFGFIDFGEIPGEEPGDPGDYYPPEIDNPIDYPDIPTPPVPGPGEPGYVEPMPGDPGYVPPGPGEPGYVPGPGEPGYTEPGTTPGTWAGGGPGGGAPWGGDIGPGDLGGAVTPGGEVTPLTGDPCEDKDDPLLKVVISYTTQEMGADEEQTLAVSGNHPRWSYENYKWTIESGGGTLSAGHALELTYTAPGTNANCEQNPTIALWCGDEIVDTLKIAVNVAGVDARAYEHKWITGYGTTCAYAPYSTDPCDYWCGPQVFYLVAQYDCAGNEIRRCAGAPYICNYTNPPDEDVFAIRGSCSDGFTTMGLHHPLGITDMRTEATKAAGCCPEVLL